MTPSLFWVPLTARGRLAVVARPRGNDWLPDEVAGWKRAGVSLVVSLLTLDEETDLGLMGEAAECAAVGVRFLQVSVPDRGVPPNRPEFERVVSEVLEEVNRGGMAAVHCRQSVGRAPLLAIAVLKAFGVSTEEATARVSVARGVQVPETKEQAEWLAGHSADGRSRDLAAWHQALCIVADFSPMAHWRMSNGAAFWWTPARSQLGLTRFAEEPFGYDEIVSLTVFELILLGNEIVACDWQALRDQLLSVRGLLVEELRDVNRPPARPPNRALHLTLEPNPGEPDHPPRSGDRC